MENKFCKYCGNATSSMEKFCSACGKELNEGVNIKDTVETNHYSNAVKIQFYKKEWFMWLMLLLFAPVGIFLMYKYNNKLTKKRKMIISIAFVLLFAISYSTFGEEKNEIKLVDDAVTDTKIEVVDFSMMAKADIDAWCISKKVNCSITMAYSDSVEKDKFISQSITVNQKISEGDSVTITYSLGIEPTVSQTNAVKKANQYLDFSAFSRKGLIEQLEYEGFSRADATYAVDNIIVDWNEQAVKKAKQYLDNMAFSRKGLIDQLEFEGFTTAEATYGVEKNGL